MRWLAVAKRKLVHERFASAWKLDARGAGIVRRALVLMSDHELSRLDLRGEGGGIDRRYAPLGGVRVLAGLSTLAGPLHGEAPARALAQLDRLLAAE